MSKGHKNFSSAPFPYKTNEKKVQNPQSKIEELGAMGISEIILVTRFLQHLSNNENSNTILYSLD